MAKAFSLIFTASSKSKLKRDFEKTIDKKHIKKVKKLAPVIERELKKETRNVGAVKTGAFVSSIKVKTSGEKIMIRHNRAGSFTKVKGKSIRLIDFIINKVKTKMKKLYNA